MARREADREDLFGEATALVERTELIVPGFTGPVTTGRSKTGGWSVYLGADPCFHFDAEGCLRRAFAEGRLYRTQGRTLAELERVQTPDKTELRRRDLDPDELARFLESAHHRLAGLRAAIRQNAVQVQRVFPRDAAVTENLEQALARILDPVLRLAPPIKGRT